MAYKQNKTQNNLD